MIEVAIIIICISSTKIKETSETIKFYIWPQGECIIFMGVTF